MIKPEERNKAVKRRGRGVQGGDMMAWSRLGEQEENVGRDQVGLGVNESLSFILSEKETIGRFVQAKAAISFLPLWLYLTA